MKVLKYPLELWNQEQRITVKGWIEVVAFQMQHDVPTIWAEVSGDGESTHRFIIVGTGHEVPAGYKHKGTVQDRGYVWHLYQAPVS